jgi:hypothetical protein
MGNEETQEIDRCERWAEPLKEMCQGSHQS